jgi:hypothetical protein
MQDEIHVTTMPSYSGNALVTANSRLRRRDIIPLPSAYGIVRAPFLPLCFALFLADNPECNQATPAESVRPFAAPDPTIGLVAVYFILHSKIGRRGNVVRERRKDDQEEVKVRGGGSQASLENLPGLICAFTEPDRSTSLSTT